MKPWILAATGLALCGKAMAAGGEKITPAEDANIRAVAYAATVANFTATNGMAFTAALAAEERKRWVREEKTLRTHGAQCLLPDFFKVAYAHVGKVGGSGYCFGLYNPLYDHLLACRVADVKKPQVVEYKWVSGEALRGEKVVSRYPQSFAARTPEDYFPNLLRVTGDVLDAFRGKFDNADVVQAFSALPALDDAGKKRLLDIAELRVAEVAKLTGDQTAVALMMSANRVLADAALAQSPNVSKDKTTQGVMSVLAKMTKELRSGFRPIGYYETDAQKCVLFHCRGLKTLLVQATYKESEGLMFSIFDANAADGWKQKLGR